MIRRDYGCGEHRTRATDRPVLREMRVRGMSVPPYTGIHLLSNYIPAVGSFSRLTGAKPQPTS